MKQITIIGNLGQDAGIKSSNGDESLRFSVGVNERRKKNGENIDETTWFTVFSYQKNLYDFLLKGTKVLVQGNVRFGVSEDDQGRTRPDVVISATLIQLLSPKREAAAEPQQQTAAPVQQQSRSQPAPVARPAQTSRLRPTPDVAMQATEDDDLPF